MEREPVLAGVIGLGVLSARPIKRLRHDGNGKRQAACNRSTEVAQLPPLLILRSYARRLLSLAHQCNRSSIGAAAKSLVVWAGRPKMSSTVRSNENKVYEVEEVAPPVAAPEPAKIAST